MQTLQSLPQVTVGLDLGDRKSAVCRMDAGGKIAQQEMISTTSAGLCAWFRDLPGSRVILEASTHSPWVSRLLTELGHEVIVANPAALRRRTHLKTDRVDADTDLRRWGLALAARGGKNAKKRAVIAVARKLSVLLLRLWRTGDQYQPLYNTNRVAA